MNFGLLIRGRLGKHNILLLSFVIFSWLCLVQYCEGTKKCYRLGDCARKWNLKNHCCVYKTSNVGLCTPRKKKHETCAMHFKYHFMKNGSVLPNQCGCDVNLTCTQIERKNWTKKLKKWSPERVKKLTRYKYKCKDIPHQPYEIREFGK